MKKSHKKNRKKSWDRKAEDQETDIPVMSINTNWGKDRSAYYEGEGDSAESSDEEHYINDGNEIERKHFSSLGEQSFKLFSNKKTLEKSTNNFTNTSEGAFEDLEKDLKEQSLNELRKCVRSVVRDVTDAARALQEEDFGNSETGKAREQLLYSLITNGCFYLHLVGSGFKETSHPALSQIRKINEILGVEGNDGEVHKEDLISGDIEEEEEEANESNQNNGDITKNPEIEEKHVPVHLQKIEEGEYRAVTRSILKNQISIPSRQAKNQAPRSKRRKKYAHAMHEYNKTHKRRVAPKDGIYKGELSGIHLRSRARSLHPAH